LYSTVGDISTGSEPDKFQSHADRVKEHMIKAEEHTVKAMEYTIKARTHMLRAQDHTSKVTSNATSNPGRADLAVKVNELSEEVNWLVVGSKALPLRADMDGKFKRTYRWIFYEWVVPVSLV
jgi:uncharacterized protein YfaP (DUF2135 family)